MPATNMASGQQTAPVASTAIATIASNKFTVGFYYKIDAYVYIDGTVAAIDDDNMTVNNSGGGFTQQLAVKAGDSMKRISFIYFHPLTAVMGAVRISSGASAATAGSVYHGLLCATEIDFVDEMTFPVP